MKTFWLTIILLAQAAVAPGQVVKRVCSVGCDYGLSQIQQAVDDAQAGWIIEIAAGQNATTVTGLVLRNKGITEGPHITIRSAGVTNLRADYRVTPTDAPNLAKVTYTFPGYLTMTAEKGAAFYRFEGIEFTILSNDAPINMIQFATIELGAIADHEIADLVHDIVFDRCYFHGYPDQEGPRRAIMANTGRLTITNSWFEDIKTNNGEGTAVGGWNCTGPFYFRNNHFSASAITTIFGGAVPNIRGIRATGVHFLGNHYYRPWKWRSTSGSANPQGTCLFDQNGGEYYRNTAANTFWQCASGDWVQVPQSQWSGGYFNKNQFELKNASQVWADGNVLENGWLPTFQSQHGAAFLINQVDNSDDFGGAGEPTAVIENVWIQNNIARNTPWAISTGVIGTYFRPIQNVFYENNSFQQLGKEPQSQGDSVGLQTTRMGRYRFAHNTMVMNLSSGGKAVAMDAGPSDQPEFYGNVVGWEGAGFNNSFTGGGNLWNAFDGAWNLNRALSKNVVVNNQHLVYNQQPFPVVNLQLPSDVTGLRSCPSCATPEYFENGGINDVGFVDFNSGDLRLKTTSRYKAWSHWGRDPGADLDVVGWSTEHAIDGAPNPYLDFQVRDVTIGSNSVQVSYTAYDENSCSVTVSSRFDYVNPVFDNPDSGGDRDRVAVVPGLTPNTRYFYRIVCAGGTRRNGILLTLM